VKIWKSTAKYEAWLGRHLLLLPDDLTLKHEEMASAAFPFLRATYYRWAQLWPGVCLEPAHAPRVLAVGDLHVDNFGTWRDAEGRLIWGINDFDETWRLPYTNDLVRLATSALIGGMACEPKAAATAILAGYAESLQSGGRPFVLAEQHPALHHLATARLKEPTRFWQTLTGLKEIDEALPAGAEKAIARVMPQKGLPWKVVHRRAGLGSLGRQRYVALAEWAGGLVAREAKALAPSAAFWAEQGKGTAPIRYEQLLESAVRCRDPFVKLHKRWVVRRLAPDCSRIELSALPKERDELRLLRAMGFETANVHLGSIAPKQLQRDLRMRGRDWLLRAAREMEKAVRADHQAYRAAVQDSEAVAMNRGKGT
jgi:hypothetical protein